MHTAVMPNVQMPGFRPKCGHRHLVKNGFRIRDFIGLPIGGKKVASAEITFMIG